MSKVEIGGEIYWKDPNGNLKPDALVKEIDKERDGLVREFAQKAKSHSAMLSQFKRQVFDDVGAFVGLSAEKYGVKIGGAKGNVSLFTYDGQFKMQLAVQDHIRFDERIHAAKALIDTCLHDWSEGAKPELKTLIDNAFEVDKEGNLSTAKILSLRRVEIDDKRWNQAMEAISDSVQVVGSKDYVRFYERNQDGKYVPIALDVAGA
ncbi:sulfate transporter [[Haemophilus] ducreyi]|uniref:Sulfate transport protein cysz n=1 Tax=Haemophilus ducreyi (strain 35000HP / ATCC 700724) TaxID=233412 RepID=Q7VNL9_HAEDU|nr:DUF3164 family protein [[Haemophilus] ducreyi]AAP95440.1 hypothetical protein HD_0489 [[Haemophilus] ducreyi 35000HP]AKO39316.1 sulfate transporter [[Haemophilus] ducreyi]ANF70199.1 sulfate transporter [[Haemophilus] ducreyi]ANF72617.1 sulfate transporter [[Haemophilus] ducreyi]ANF73459.1 sulfate transporter [[Haemophilus] ducreyi]